MDCREASSFILLILFPLHPSLAVCLYFTEWICGFTNDIDALEVKRGKRRLFIAGGKRLVLNILLMS